MQYLQPARERIRNSSIERVNGFDPSFTRWQRIVLPMNYTRTFASNATWNFSKEAKIPVSSARSRLTWLGLRCIHRYLCRFSQIRTVENSFGDCCVTATLRTYMIIGSDELHFQPSFQTSIINAESRVNDTHTSQYVRFSEPT